MDDVRVHESLGKASNRDRPIFPRRFHRKDISMAIQWVSLSSSAIDRVGYDSDRRQLHVEFRDGPTSYTHCRVPEHIFAGLTSASSAGQYYSAHIRGRYQC